MQLLTRALRLFGDIRHHEVGRALRLMFGLFALMVSYYVLKTLREPLILATGGAELKAYAAGAQAFILIFAVRGYDRLSAAVPRDRLIRTVVFFFVVCIGLFAIAAWLKMPMLGFVFFVWVGIFSLATIAQFWSLANDLYSRGDGERLFPIIAIGQATGAVAGSEVAKQMFAHGLGVISLLAISGVLLLVHLALCPLSETGGTQPLKHASGGFGLVWNSPYLRLLATMLILLNLVNTTGEYILSKFAEEVVVAKLGPDAGAEARKSQFGIFYGSFFRDVNVVVLLLQTLVVSRLVKYTGFRGALLALPLISLGTYTSAGLGVGVMAFRWLKLAENATDYSVMNTAKAMAWLPTTRAEKYRAKQALDTFFVRLGDMLSAGMVFVGTELLLWRRSSFAWFNVAAVAVWLVVSLAIARHYRAAAQQQTDASDA